jgi:hypothetical protein
LGTHKHRDDNRRGSKRRRGSGHGTGGVSGSGGIGSESGGSEQDNQFKELKRSVDTRIDNFLQDKKYSKASFLAANISFRNTHPDEIASVLLAGITALKEGRKTEWRPKAEDIARSAIETSSSVIKYNFSKESKAIVTQVLIREIKKASGGAP